MGGAAAARVKLRPLAVLRQSLAVYREHWAGLIVGALIIFAPLSVLDALLANHDAHGAAATALEATAESALHLFGDVFYAGIVAAAVIAWRQGARRQRAIDVARALSWGTIVVLDLVLTAGSVILALGLVIPGIVFYVYMSLAPSTAKIEHVGVRVALRRSAGMVRGNFWRVLAVLALVLVVAGAVEEGLQALFDVFAADAIVHLLAESLSAPLYGLATVLMTFELGARSVHPHGE
jgi:hypothetical protein